jgi:hypothetical protein
MTIAERLSMPCLAVEVPDDLMDRSGHVEIKTDIVIVLDDGSPSCTCR